MTDVLRGRLTTLYAATMSEIPPECQFLRTNEGLTNAARPPLMVDRVLWQPSGNHKSRFTQLSGDRLRPKGKPRIP